MIKSLDIVSDLGEGFGSYQIADDDSLLQIVSSANIACGFHAGDPRTMASTVQKCIANNVAIGAHPSFPDRVGFGRRGMDLSALEVETDMLYQIGALNGFAQAFGTKLQHVTPHGKLGNYVVEDSKYANAVAEAIAKFDDSLIIVTLPGELAEAAKKKGLRIAYTIFADRAYNTDGSLVSRNQPSAVLHDIDLITSRVLRMVNEGKVTSITGQDITVKGSSLLLHGDTAGSVQMATKIRDSLIANGIIIKSLNASK